MRRAGILILTLLGAVLLTAAFIRSVAAANPATDQPPAQGRPAPHLQAPRARLTASSGTCYDGVQASGAKYRICMPVEQEWNDDLIVYAHGYVAPDQPVEIPEDQLSLPNFPLSVDEVVNSLGFAFATTSYYTNGLAVLPAISDLLELVDLFAAEESIPDHVYLAGVSEGGLITALSVEQHPEVYDGGLAMCGPYGDFQDQVNHYGDFRVVFDYFFPDLMPGEPFSTPASLPDEWESGFFTTTILPAITDDANAISVTQLLTVTDVSPYAYAPPTSTGSIEKLLWYNVFATHDAVAKLGGQPFDNQERWYSGSNDDTQLNDEVERFSADQLALDEIAAHYQTTGRLRVPLVTLHTTGDEGVPYRHAIRYQEKAVAAGSSLLHEHVRVERHGHCNFTASEILGAFVILVDMVDNQVRAFLPMIVRVP
jgi:pimeloyl-ACP methyl ester carboxylesterase